MKRFVFAIAGTVALAESLGPAATADLSRPSHPSKVAAYNAAYNWNGLYAGENASHGWGSSTWSALGSSFDTNGGIVGGRFGYSWQVGHFVHSVEDQYPWHWQSSGLQRDGLPDRGRLAVHCSGPGWRRGGGPVAAGLAVEHIRATVPGLAPSTPPMPVERSAAASSSLWPPIGARRSNISTSTSATRIAAARAASRPAVTASASPRRSSAAASSATSDTAAGLGPRSKSVCRGAAGLRDTAPLPRPAAQLPVRNWPRPIPIRLDRRHLDRRLQWRGCCRQRA
jgi:hypothetical protein